MAWSFFLHTATIRRSALLYDSCLLRRCQGYQIAILQCVSYKYNQGTGENSTTVRRLPVNIPTYYRRGRKLELDLNTQTRTPTAFRKKVFIRRRHNYPPAIKISLWCYSHHITVGILFYNSNKCIQWAYVLCTWKVATREMPWLPMKTTQFQEIPAVNI